MTLVELLVMLAIMLVVLGLAYEMMTQSDRATRQAARTQAAAQYCQNALGVAVRTIRCAADSAQFAGLGDFKPKFSKNELSLIAFDRAATGGFARVSITNEKQGKRGGGIRRRITALGDAASSATRAEELGGSSPEGFEAAIRFGYAATPTNLGKGVNYQNEWTSAGLPALIQVTVTARIEEESGRRREVPFQTAVIPGLVAAKDAAVTSASVTSARATAGDKTENAATSATASKPPTPATVQTPATASSATAAPEAEKPLKVLQATQGIRVVDRAKLDRLKGGGER